MSVPGALARIDSAQAALERLVKALGFAAGALRRSRAEAVTSPLYLATAEAELHSARELAKEAFELVALATATPEPRS